LVCFRDSSQLIMPKKTSKGGRPRGILIWCPNHLRWLVSTRSSYYFATFHLIWKTKTILKTECHKHLWQKAVFMSHSWLMLWPSQTDSHSVYRCFKLLLWMNESSCTNMTQAKPIMAFPCNPGHRGESRLNFLRWGLFWVSLIPQLKDSVFLFSLIHYVCLLWLSLCLKCKTLIFNTATVFGENKWATYIIDK